MAAPTDGRTKDRNAELMRDMGSETGRYDPEPPEQWRWDLAHGTPKMRFRAWVKWKTTGHKDFETRSPFCVSEHGTPLTLQHAAVDLGWSIQATRKVAAEVERDGFVRLQKGGKIFNRADVPVSTEPPPEAPNESVQARWSPYLTDSIRSLPPEKREEFNAIEAEYLEWSTRGFAEMVASWRLMDEQVQDSMFARVGIEKKRLPKTEREKPPVVQLSLLELPSFVQTGDTNSALESVQNAKPQRTKPKKGSHKPPRGAASLLPLEEDQELKSVGRSVVESTPAKDRPTDPPQPVSEKAETQHTTAEDVRQAILSELHHRMPHEVPTLKMCGRIALALRRLPLERFSLALRARKWKPDDTMGLCEKIAADVIEVWKIEERERTRATRARWRTASWYNHEIQQSAREALEDPACSEEDRIMARQIIDFKKAKGTSS